jgi:toxin FitB
VILLDTNVLSEVLRPAPSQNVVQWLNRNFSDAAISSITIFELAAGVAIMAKGRRRETLENAIARTQRRFGSRIYAFDAAAAFAAAKLLALARKRAHPLQHVQGKLADLQIAGIVAAYGLSLATRNVTDFAGLDLDLVDPWTA